MSDGKAQVYRHESRAKCKHCGKYPPAPRNWLCGNCIVDLRGRDPLDPEKIAQAAKKHQAERSRPAPAMGYTVRKVAKLC